MQLIKIFLTCLAIFQLVRLEAQKMIKTRAELSHSLRSHLCQTVHSDLRLYLKDNIEDADLRIYQLDRNIEQAHARKLAHKFAKKNSHYSYSVLKCANGSQFLISAPSPFSFARVVHKPAKELSNYCKRISIDFAENSLKDSFKLKKQPKNAPKSYIF